jgi:hypothetical protein
MKTTTQHRRASCRWTGALALVGLVLAGCGGQDAEEEVLGPEGPGGPVAPDPDPGSLTLDAVLEGCLAGIERGAWLESASRTGVRTLAEETSLSWSMVVPSDASWRSALAQVQAGDPAMAPWTTEGELVRHHVWIRPEVVEPLAQTHGVREALSGMAIQYLPGPPAVLAGRPARVDTVRCGPQGRLYVVEEAMGPPTVRDVLGFFDMNQQRRLLDILGLPEPLGADASRTVLAASDRAWEDIGALRDTGTGPLFQWPGVTSLLEELNVLPLAPEAWIEILPADVVLETPPGSYTRALGRTDEGRPSWQGGTPQTQAWRARDGWVLPMSRPAAPMSMSTLLRLAGHRTTGNLLVYEGIRGNRPLLPPAGLDGAQPSVEGPGWVLFSPDDAAWQARGIDSSTERLVALPAPLAEQVFRTATSLLTRVPLPPGELPVGRQETPVDRLPLYLERDEQGGWQVNGVPVEPAERWVGIDGVIIPVSTVPALTIEALLEREAPAEIVRSLRHAELLPPPSDLDQDAVYFTTASADAWPTPASTTDAETRATLLAHQVAWQGPDPVASCLMATESGYHRALSREPRTTWQAVDGSMIVEPTALAPVGVWTLLDTPCTWGPFAEALMDASMNEALADPDPTWTVLYPPDDEWTRFLTSLGPSLGSDWRVRAAERTRQVLSLHVLPGDVAAAPREPITSFDGSRLNEVDERFVRVMLQNPRSLWRGTNGQVWAVTGVMD